MSDTTPDGTDHAAAIRKIASRWATRFGPFIDNDHLWYTDTFLDGKDAGEIGGDMQHITRHAAALDAARVAAEQRAERLGATVLAYRANVETVLAQYDPEFVPEFIGDSEQELVDGDLDAERARAAQRPEVWAVIELDYDDYAVGEPLSYHWSEASAKAWIQRMAFHRRRNVTARKIRIAGDT